MRNRPEWFTRSDDTILEFLEDTSAAFSKRGLEENLKLRGESVSYSTLKRRLSKLETEGFVENVGESKPRYQITDQGRAYLEGELDAGTLESDE